MNASRPPRTLYITFATLTALSILLASLLLWPGAELAPLRGTVPFQLDEPPPGGGAVP
jgi:hypothetical protein